MWKGAVENASVVQVHAEPTAEHIWSRVVEHAKRDLPESSFNMWFAEVRPGTLEGGVLELVAPSEYVRDWLAKNHIDLIDTAVKEASDGAVQARLTSDPGRTRVVAEPVV